MILLENRDALLSDVLIAEVAAGVPVVPAIDPTIPTIPLLRPGVEIILRIRGNLLEKLVISTVLEGSSVEDLVPGVGAMVLVIPAVDHGVSAVSLVVSPIVFVVGAVRGCPDVLVILSPSPTNDSPRPMPSRLGQRRTHQVRTRGGGLDGGSERQWCTPHHAK